MADTPDQSSFVEQLRTSINRDASTLLSFILGFTIESDSDNPNRIILIDPSQGMLVLEGRSSSSFDSLLSDLMSDKGGQPPASMASIDALSRVEIKEGGGEEGECAICLEEWKVGDEAREMPCKHRFHGGCVEKWLKVHGTCPVCRYRMPVDDDLGKKDESPTMESNERESEGRMRGIWVGFSIRNEEGPRNQRGSSSDDSS